MYPATPDPEQTFETRHAAWQARSIQLGPTAAFPFAWRLPELARGLARPHRLRAGLALACTLYGQGRFADCLIALAELPTTPGDAPRQAAHLEHLGACCRWIMAQADNLPLSADPDLRLDSLYLGDAAATLLDEAPRQRQAALLAGHAPEAAWADLLLDWARARTGLPGDARASHSALSLLGATHPSRAALGAGIHAHAAYLREGPWALPWLDQALLLADRLGQHLDQARLLHLKARALEADGQLADAERFLKLARETARRQGAWRWLEDMAR